MAQTPSLLPRDPMPKILPAATDGVPKPTPSPSAVHNLGGPAFGQTCSNPFSADLPSRLGPRHWGQSPGATLSAASAAPATIRPSAAITRRTDIEECSVSGGSPSSEAE